MGKMGVVAGLTVHQNVKFWYYGIISFLKLPLRFSVTLQFISGITAMEYECSRFSNLGRDSQGSRISFSFPSLWCFSFQYARKESLQSQLIKPLGFCKIITMAIGLLCRTQMLWQFVCKELIQQQKSKYNNNAQCFDQWYLSGAYTMLYEKL